MAQPPAPPTIPSMTQLNWHPLPQPIRLPAAPPSSSSSAAAGIQQNPWADEFLEFSSARRGAHRRSASDSIAFLEAEDFRGPVGNSYNCFDRLDDEQLTSMFSDEVTVAMPPPLSLISTSSDPSTPPEQKSNNEEKEVNPAPTTTAATIPIHLSDRTQHLAKIEPGSSDVDSSTKNAATAANSSNGDAIVDPKKVKRILANRQSAQRSRVRKLQYISELERSVTTLQSEVSALSPRVAFLDHQRLILNVDNSALKQRIAALAQDKIFKDAHQEALKKEIERLRQMYHHQQKLNKPNATGYAQPTTHFVASLPPSKQPPQEPRESCGEVNNTGSTNKKRLHNREN